MSVRIPVITVWQPWATLICEEVKPFEFRRWRARFVGRRIGIHSGARRPVVAEIQALLLRCRSDGADGWHTTGLVDRAKTIMLLTEFLLNPEWLPISCLVCTALIGSPVRDEELASRLGTKISPINDSDRDEHTNWGWPLFNVKPLHPPIPTKGRQGFWFMEVPDEYA
jgi:hypothetical protein